MLESPLMAYSIICLCMHVHASVFKPGENTHTQAPTHTHTHTQKYTTVSVLFPEELVNDIEQNALAVTRL